MKLSKEDVRHVAELARLQLTDAEIEEYAGQLGQILAYAQQIQAVDTSSLEPTPSVLPLTNALADDSIKDSLPPEQAVANAPDAEDGYFRVIAVFDSSGP